MMKKVLIIVGIILLALIIVIAVKYIDNNTNIGRPTATINDQSFNLYVAKTPKDKEIGLSKYESLPENYGMLFPFDKAAIHSFWMKNMKFPIDIIFIKDRTIVTIHKNVPNPSVQNTSLPIYMPKTPAKLVLEINAGLSEKYNFQEGDTVIIKNLKGL